ncbi:unnamed protein product [Schistocephalus solidus]|uniref:Uncharacterized protein n=1 Tax=Schistocephalus solidus TaxID=70667 RepID=A0A3P7EJB1_SCHSO|nr:unnamed protein product [Schistocephalus solidus]
MHISASWFFFSQNSSNTASYRRSKKRRSKRAGDDRERSRSYKRPNNWSHMEPLQVLGDSSISQVQPPIGSGVGGGGAASHSSHPSETTKPPLSSRQFAAKVSTDSPKPVDTAVLETSTTSTAMPRSSPPSASAGLVSNSSSSPSSCTQQAPPALSTSTQTPPVAMPPAPAPSHPYHHNHRHHQQSTVQQLMWNPLPPPPTHYPVLGYMDSLSIAIWQFFLDTRQTSAKYAKKVHLRNAMHMMVSAVFENSKLFIVGSSINGFGFDQSDMDLCLTITSEELQNKYETSVVLTQLMEPLRRCSFIRNCNLIRAKVPILKFHDTLTGVDCDLNVNNVIGIYNTHLLAMYTRVDWRVRPLGLFVKHWAQKMDIHDGSRGRLSTYPLLLMLLQYLQCGCSPPIIPNLQARFPKLFNYERPVNELDMRLELPWAELRSSNTATLSELFAGFIQYYNSFDFNQWAISIKHGAPMPINVAIRCLPPHEQAHTTTSFKIFVEEPFSQTNAARSLYDDNVLSLIQQAFHRTDRALRLQKPLESVWVNTRSEG